MYEDKKIQMINHKIIEGPLDESWQVRNKTTKNKKKKGGMNMEKENQSDFIMAIGY